jgi:type III secretion protein U
MAGQQDTNEQKDHKPTTRKLRKARKQGHVSQSRELTAAIALAIGVCTVALMLPWISRSAADLWAAVLTMIEHPGSTKPLGLAMEAMSAVAAMALTVLLVSAGAGVIASRIQTGPVFSAEPMKPQIQHLNPVSNAKRLLSMRTLVQFALLAAKTLVIGVGVYLIYVNILGDAVRMVLGGVGAGLAVFEKAVLWLTVWGVVAFLAISAFDLWFQRFQFTKDMSMSMREMRRELKEDEGDPIIKSARRRAGREPMLHAQLQFVSMAAIVLDNGEDRVIALFYAPHRLPKPVVTIRAAGMLAQTVKKMAQDAGAPIITHATLVNDMWPTATPNFAVADAFAPEAIAMIRRYNKKFAK